MKYSIKAASKLSGLTTDTIRVWERRYGAVTPEREGKGRRLYNDDEIERLQLLSQATDLGNPIRMLAPLSNDELRRLIEKGRSRPIPRNAAAETVRRLIAAIERHEFEEYEKELAWAAVALKPWHLVTEIFFPLLKEVGDRWHEGRLSVAQEHAVSSSLRNLVGAMIRLYPKNAAAPTILFAAPGGERHEFGILMLALLAASEGANCIYLGPDLPAEEIAAMAERSRCDIVAVGVVNLPDVEETRGQIEQLQREVGSWAELWIGGEGARQLREQGIAFPGTFVEDLHDFDRKLKLTIGKRRQLQEATA